MAGSTNNITPANSGSAWRNSDEKSVVPAESLRNAPQNHAEDVSIEELLPEGVPFYDEEEGVTSIRVGNTILSYSQDEDFEIRSLAEAYEFLGALKAPMDIELPDISALTPFDGFPENVTDIEEPVYGPELALHLQGRGMDVEMNNVEAQWLVTGLAADGYGASPIADHGGDNSIIYSHVLTPDGTDSEIRALIFRSVPVDGVSDRGAMACWATSTLLSTTERLVRLYERDSDDMVEEYEPQEDYVDAASAVKVFSVIIPDSEKSSAIERQQYAELLGYVVAQWLEPDFELLDAANEVEEARKEEQRKMLADAKAAKEEAKKAK